MGKQTKIPEVQGLSRVLLAARKSGNVRVVYFGTRDRDSALARLKEASGILNAPLYHFTVSERRRFDAGAMIWRVTGDQPVESVECLRAARPLSEGIVILEDMLPLLRDGDGGNALLRQELAYLTSEHVCGGLVLVFLDAPLAECHLPAVLADQFIRIEEQPPTRRDLEMLARMELPLILHGTGRVADVSTIRDLANQCASNLAGLGRTASREALRDAFADIHGDFSGALRHLAERKQAQLARDLQMRVISAEDVAATEEPIGLDYLLDYLRINRERMSWRGPDRARGVLLIGPPGTGKSMQARAIARQLDLPLVEFAVAALMDSLLGATEKRFHQAYATLKALAPAAVQIDEIDKLFATNGGEQDGGTMSRVMGSLLTFLAECQEPVYVIATANGLKRMGELGATLSRSERLDAIFFVDVPSREAREHILARRLAGRIADAPHVGRDLSRLTQRFTGADLVSVVKQAEARGYAAGSGLTLPLLRSQIESKRPRADSLYAEFQPLRDWAASNCEPAGPTGD